MNHVDQVELARFQSQLSFQNKLVRLVWGWVWLLLFRPSPRSAFGWRRLLLRMFGASLGCNTRVYPSTRVFYPPNLKMGDHSILGPDVDCYCVGKIVLEANVMVSQYSYLCGATHDYTKPDLPLQTGDIMIGKSSWVCADVFIGPGVTVHEGAVVGTRSTVTKDVPAWQVVAGNPPRVIRPRVLSAEE